MRVTFYTLGCKVNQNETGALAQLFEESGYTVVPNEEDADVYVVNSCTVTNFGDQKSRKWLRRAKRENPGAVTVLTGCYPQAFPEEAAGIMEADVVTGSGNRRAILQDVQKVLDGEAERVVDIRPHEKGERFEELPMDKFAEHTRAFVKVEDGCNRQCAYCVIPRARGPVRSRDEASILQELHRLTESGYKEIVLTAISLPSYGTDTGTSLVDLVEKAAAVPGVERLRLGSLDPDMLHDDDIFRLSRVEKLCPQFHLSLQSGCDKTLRAMRRPYTTAQFANVELTTTGIPTMETISNWRVLLTTCIKAISACSIKILCENKSPHEYPVRLSSGNITICTPLPSATIICVSVCCALNLQSATFTAGIAAATFTKPNFI